MKAIEFIRDSGTQSSFDGWWQVWSGTEHFGRVRKHDNPAERGRPWGYEAPPSVASPNGVICRAGFRTRAEAGQALAERVRRETA